MLIMLIEMTLESLRVCEEFITTSPPRSTQTMIEAPRHNAGIG